MADGHCCRFLEIILAIILPPLGVFLRYGLCSLEFWLSVFLTLLGYVPGIIYAVFVIVASPRTTNRDLEEPLPAYTV